MSRRSGETTVLHYMQERFADRTRGRLSVHHGQMRTPYFYKNLRMTLTVNGEFHEFAYGDMNRADFEAVKAALLPGQEFLGWNEHQGTDWQQTDLPLVRITCDEITFPAHEAGKWGPGCEDRGWS